MALRDAGDLFYLGQIALGVLFVGGLLFFRGRGEKSAFKLREADRARPRGSASIPPGTDSLAQARLKPPASASPGGGQNAEAARPLALDGIRIDVAPHQILGIPAHADAQQIQKSFRELMKRFHPDKIGRPGTREWQDAQKIAQAIQGAKEAMLKNLKDRPRV